MSCKHYLQQLTKEDRHYVNAEHLNNCVLCVSEQEGPMTQDEISKYLGISKMRVSQLQKIAETKFGKRMKKILS